MAKTRMVNTRFWIDDYISNLDPTEKLLFLYFITNPATDISGVYEIPLKNVALDTGIDKEMVIKILGRFERDDKIKHRDGWIVIRNFIKHQTDNPKVAKGIELSLAKSPRWCIDYLYPMDSLSHSNSNSNSNSEGEAKASEDQQIENPKIPEIIKEFEAINPACKKMYGNTTQRTACKNLIDTYTFDRVVAVIKGTLPKTNTMEYFPTITTPLQLFDKWAMLESKIVQYQSNQKTLLAKKKINVY